MTEGEVYASLTIIERVFRGGASAEDLEKARVSGASNLKNALSDIVTITFNRSVTLKKGVHYPLSLSKHAANTNAIPDRIFYFCFSGGNPISSVCYNRDSDNAGTTKVGFSCNGVSAGVYTKAVYMDYQNALAAPDTKSALGGARLSLYCDGYKVYEHEFRISPGESFKASGSLAPKSAYWPYFTLREQNLPSCVSTPYYLGYAPDYVRGSWSFDDYGYNYNPANLTKHSWTMTVDKDVSFSIIGVKV